MKAGREKDMMMAYNPKYNNQRMEYRKKKLKRITMDVQKEWYESELLPAVQNANETVNGYIKKAVQDRIDNERSS